MYSSEAWVPKVRYKSKIQVSEMWFLKIVVWITRWDRQRNEDVCNRLNLFSILPRIDEDTDQWE